MVQSGGCSASDFREVFKKNIERRVRSLPEIDGLSKETVLSSWITKYDVIFKGEDDQRRSQGRMPFSAVSELILSKEQLYEMFQQILGIKKFEHQLLYNACQVSFFLTFSNAVHWFGISLILLFLALFLWLITVVQHAEQDYFYGLKSVQNVSCCFETLVLP